MIKEFMLAKTELKVCTEAVVPRYSVKKVIFKIFFLPNSQ